MYLYVTAGADAEFGGLLAIDGVGVRDVQRQMKLTLAIFGIDQVVAFGDFVVTGGVVWGRRGRC